MTQKKIHVLKDVRLSFFSIFKPSTPIGYENSSEPKFSATVLLEKGSQQLQEMQQMIADIKKENLPFPEERWKWICLYDGDGPRAVSLSGERYDGFPGNWALALRSKFPVTIVDRQNNPIAEEKNPFYSGCYVNVQLGMSGNTQNGNINGFLQGIQFVRDGQALGGAGGGSLFERLDTLDPAPSAFEEI